MSKKTIFKNALIANEEGGYSRVDVVVCDEKIVSVNPTKSIIQEEGRIKDCTNLMLLPGWVNSHTHSSEHGHRGLIRPLPLEMWAVQLFQSDPRDRIKKAIELAALQCGIESMLSGCTAILDHLYVRTVDEVGIAVESYKKLGIRAYIAPMLGDDPDGTNYIPLSSKKCNCGGLGPQGKFRERTSSPDPQLTQKVLSLWRQAIELYHDPLHGIEIVLGPVTAYSASAHLLKGAAALRKEFNLCGHCHLLETRGQALMAFKMFNNNNKDPARGAVTHLKDNGFLDCCSRPTSLAHCVWVSDKEMQLLAETNTVVVHNPLSNLRLGSGIAPISKMLQFGLPVALGCDGSCSSDGQDMLEVLKLATFLPTLHSPDYRDWPSPRQIALQLAARNGYKALGINAGAILPGMEADFALWDLTSLALLPHTDPLSLLIQGSRCISGTPLDSLYVRGIQVVDKGQPLGFTLAELRSSLLHAYASEQYRDSLRVTDPSNTGPFAAACENEYRAAMNLDKEEDYEEETKVIFYPPSGRVLYDAKITL
uniref:Amidohydrolase-related domain-containing protein n=1 Tax=Aureoumbra lagunensis TaxID=44058 RepID=A0A7S3K242_9STRA